LLEEFAEDAYFVGISMIVYVLLLRVGRDVYVGYFIVVCPVDDDPKLFCLAKVLTKFESTFKACSFHLNPILDTCLRFVTSIWIHIVDETQKKNVWREDQVISLN